MASHWFVFRNYASSSAELLSPLVICGPSGVGKGTILRALRSKYPFFIPCISHTTRSPRQGEQNGVDYHFVSREKFSRMIQQKAFVEHAHVHGNLYGTSRVELEAIEARGNICVLEIDVQGAMQIREAQLSPMPRFLFVSPPSMEFLAKRIRGRGSETEDKILLRLQNAAEELAFAEKEGDLFDLTIIHDEIDRTLPALERELHHWYPSKIPLQVMNNKIAM